MSFLQENQPFLAPCSRAVPYLTPIMLVILGYLSFLNSPRARTNLVPLCTATSNQPNTGHRAAF